MMAAGQVFLRKFFGFKENPFKLAPDPAYLFLGKSHEEDLAHRSARGLPLPARSSKACRSVHVPRKNGMRRTTFRETVTLNDRK
jgi:hypothetical protein